MRHREKTELARELLEVLAGWVGEQRCGIALDAASCNDTVTRGLARSLALFARLPADAALTAAPAAVLAANTDPDACRKTLRCCPCRPRSRSRCAPSVGG